MMRTRSTLQAQRVRLAIVLIVGVAALAACVIALLRWQAGPAWATYPGQNGEIAFQGRGSLGTDIFSISPAGTGVSQLTQTEGVNEYNPSYSANGSRVAFDTDRDGNQEIYTMDANGGDQTRLTIDTEFLRTFDGEPAFSPGGSEIVFARVNDKGPSGVDRDIDIYTMAATPGAVATRVVRVPGIDEQPSFRPDGSQILFVNHGNGSNIYVVDRDGSNLVRLAEGHDPVWSPDGERIAFEYGGQIFMMNADGSYQQAVVEGGSLHSHQTARESPTPTTLSPKLPRAKASMVSSPRTSPAATSSRSIPARRTSAIPTGSR